MSGVLAAVAAAGGQQPKLTAHTFTDNSAAPGFGLRFFRNGTLQVAQGDGTVKTFFGEWGGTAPPADMGDGYDVRLTRVSALGTCSADTENEGLDIWYNMNDPVNAFPLYVFNGDGMVCDVRVDIRRHDFPNTIVASAVWQLRT